MIYFIGSQLFSEFETCTIEEAVQYLEQQKVIGLDIETTRKFPKSNYNESVYKAGLDPYLSRVIMLQIGTLERRYVIDTRCVNIDKLKPILESEKILKVGANLVFECNHLQVSFGITLKNLYDVLLVDRIMTNGLYDSYSLESLMRRYRGYKGNEIFMQDLFGEDSFSKEVKKLFDRRKDEYFFLKGDLTEEEENELWEECLEEVKSKYVDKSIRLEFVELKDQPFRKDMILYGSTDIEEPLHLREIFMKGRLVDGKYYYPDVAIRQENKLIEILSKMIVRGVDFDKVKWLNVAKSKIEKRWEIVRFLDEYILKQFPEYRGTIDMFDNKPSSTMNWASPKQVQTLFDKLGLSVIAKSKFTGKMEKTVGAKELLFTLPNDYKVKFMTDTLPEKIESGKDLVLTYLILKKYQMLTTTYGEEFLSYVHPITKRIHCNVRQYLNTSRMAATRPKFIGA